MADLQDTLLEEFQEIQGAMTDSTEAWSVNGGGEGGAQRDTAPRGDVDSLGDQTGAIDHGSRSNSSGSSSGGAMSDLGGALAAGLGIVPLGLEIASLFEGGPSTPPTLTNYAMPDSVGFIGSSDGSGLFSDADFGQNGQPRSYDSGSNSNTSSNNINSISSNRNSNSNSSSYSSSSYSSTVNTSAPAPAAQTFGGNSQSQPIQITVQAMDAQSIMDRSDDIASAVQKAMNNLHPIVDTISNL